MKRFLDIHRAARIAGVRREEIQRLIAEGSLNAFEGKVDLTELLKLYPEIERSRISMLEMVSQIKEDAVAKALKRESGVQDAASLMDELRHTRAVGAYHEKHADAYRQIILDLRRMLVDLREKVGQKQRVEAMIKWLDHKMRSLS